VFEADFAKLAVLGVLALLIFGPERLPAMAAQAGQFLRELRRMAEGAKSELQENLGPEFSNFDINDLNPKHFVRKHLVDELTGDGMLLGKMAANGGATNGSATNGSATNGSATNGSATNGSAANGNGTLTGQSMPAVTLAAGERPPYDAEAT
jgi:sec-independent protein translocase protein TatB